MSLLQWVAPNCLVDHLRDAGSDEPLISLVDVGVSGGIYPDWRRWGRGLRGLGIDVIEDEVARLAEKEENPALSYVAARVGAPNPSLAHERTTYALHRSQAYLATAVLDQKRSDFREEWRKILDGQRPFEANFANIPDPSSDPFYGYYLRRFGGADASSLSKRVATVDELVGESHLPSVDVIKVDTDGYDLDVLLGAEKTLSQCVAVEVEVQFHGPVGPGSNIFSNIDLFLREKGFGLTSLYTYNYSRSELPQKFLYGIPAQTARGPIAWGDALFTRDVIDTPVDDEKKRALALIFDLYGLEDCAAEIILAYPSLFNMPDRQVLDFLARKVHGESTGYEALTSGFLKDPISYP